MVAEELKEKVECIYELAKLKGCKISAEDMMTMIQTNMTVPCHTDDYKKFRYSELQCGYIYRCNKLGLYDVELLYKWQMDYALAEIPSKVKEEVIKALDEYNMDKLYDIALHNLGIGVAYAIKSITNRLTGKPILTAADIREMANQI